MQITHTLLIPNVNIMLLRFVHAIAHSGGSLMFKVIHKILLWIWIKMYFVSICLGSILFLPLLFF